MPVIERLDQKLWCLTLTIEGIMDTKLYVEWRETIKKWVVKFQGRVISQHDTQADAQKWVERHYPSHAYETERVEVRKNSPRGARPGEWRK